MLQKLPDPPPEPSRPASRRVLVADDDASTREFLSAALKGLGYAPTLATDGPDALAIATSERLDILLLDCRMPGSGAVEVLTALRKNAHAASRDAHAFATSAEMSPTQRQALLAAGFVGVIEKPCRVATLGQALSSAVTQGATSDLKRLDDDEAMQATGDIRTMQALRALFRQELAQLDSEMDTLAPEALVERLHRLRSGCGFCGTPRLGTQVRALQVHVDTHRQVRGDTFVAFRKELRATLAALEAALP